MSSAASIRFFLGGKLSTSEDLTSYSMFEAWTVNFHAGNSKYAEYLNWNWIFSVYKLNLVEKKSVDLVFNLRNLYERSPLLPHKYLITRKYRN